MFRKSSLAAALLMALSAGNALALGLGDIELKSALNQPLDAEIELLSATDAELQELKVAIGSTESFARAGIDRPLFLSKLRFDVVQNAQGEPVIRVSSRDSVQEPFLDFILEVSWSKGRLVREYTVLVDPPVTMPAPPPVSSAPAVAARATAAQQSPRRFTHTGNFPTVPASPGEYGPTRRNDTLWKVAQQVRPDTGVSMEQTMLGLLRANPQAFVANNINNLKAGYVLRVPSRDELTSVSKADALRESRAQYAAWRAAQGVPAVSGQQVVEPAAGEAVAGDIAPQTEAEPSLQLVSPDMETGDSPTGAATTGSKVDALQRELMMANEVLEGQRRQDEEMSRRLEMLEEQIVNMQRLIQLKDNELARLQAVAAEQVVDMPPAEAPQVVAESAPLDEAVDSVAEDQPVPDETEAEVIAAISEQPLDGVAAEAESEIGEPVETGMVPGPLVDEDMAAAVEETVTATVADEALVDGLVAEQMPVADESLQADATETTMVEEPAVDVGSDPVTAGESATPVAAVTPEVPETATTPGFVDRLLQNPLYLGAGAVVLALLGFFGIRRKRGVDSEFQESILQAAHEDSTINIADSVGVSGPESTDQSATDSSLLSEFAVSDMGSLRSGGEADPLSEADVYLAYGRYQQAEDLIREALQADADNDALTLKLLEVYLAARNQSAFDEYAQDILARLENSEDPLWEKVAEMGRELNPENPMYQVGSAASSVDGEVDEIEELEEGLDFDFGSFGTAQDEVSAESARPEESVDSEPEPEADAVVDFNLDLPVETQDQESQPVAENESEAFDQLDMTGSAAAEEQAEEELKDSGLAVAMDSVEPDNVTQESSLDFDIDSLDLGAEEAELSGDGELADLDEISTKLDLARAYIDMGDPDGARSILDEVLQEGNSEQQDEAQDIMQMIA